MQNAVFASWTIPPWATFFLLVTAVIYWRGWRQIRRTRPEQFPKWRLFCFVGGLLTIWLAISSPLDALSGMLLVVHMTQHLLLMSVAPPLVVLGAPQVPMLRGLPRFWIREGLGPFFSLAPVHALERLFKSRLFAWVAMNFAFIAWHLPAAYDLALAHPQLHEIEHACFFLTSVLFWWPIIEPWPVVYKGSRWLMLPYLMSADIVNTALSAFLSFSGRVVYPVYANAPRIFRISAINDQVAAGSLMWVLGSTAFLGPIMWITLTQLSRRGERRQAAARERTEAAASIAALEALWHLQAPAFESGALASADYVSSLSGLPGEAALKPKTKPRVTPLVKAAAGLDLFALPPVGAFFKSRYGRQSLQALMLLASAAVIVDGFFGHPMSSMNLAGVVPWTYARALFVLALLSVGNLFCMSCPFMLPRELAKKIALSLGFARLPWPRRLRGKWLSATLLGLFFWAYEAFALWDSPLRTAALLMAYFLTAITIDSIFRGASFCKYVCPLGQFNFVSSLLSPASLQARSQTVCAGCETRDCIAGHEKQRGCELDLFMPQKSGNLDCTLCMDCVKACPHDNIGLFLEPPARELVQLTLSDPQRSSVGRYSRRPDVAALALLLTAAAFVSAAVMVSPISVLFNGISSALPPWIAASAGLGLTVAAPAVLFGLVAVAVLVMHRRLKLRALSLWALAPNGPTTPPWLPTTVVQQKAAAALYRGPGDTSLRAQLCRWTLALLPLGLAMWAAHLVFHLVTAWSALPAAVGQMLLDAHILTRAAGVSAWGSGSSLLTAGTLLQVQLLVLDAGLLFALYLGWRMVSVLPLPDADPVSGRQIRPSSLPLLQRLAILAPWASVVLLLYAAGVWVLLEPMQMRGMMGM